MTLAISGSKYKLLFIDAFEAIPASQRPETAAVLHGVMQELSDKHPHTRVAVAGAADAAADLVPFKTPPRRIDQIRIPPMPRDQLTFILDRGSRLLKLRFETGAQEAIVEAADGYPFFVHHLAQYAILEGRRRDPNQTEEVVTYADFERSLERAFDAAELQLTKPYLAAIERTGGRRPRKQVLEALAAIKKDEASIAEIRRSHGKLFAKDQAALRAGGLRTPLQQLVDHYPLLVEIPQGGNKGNLYRFRDPLMKSYVRLNRRYPHLVMFDREELLAG